MDETRSGFGSETNTLLIDQSITELFTIVLRYRAFIYFTPAIGEIEIRVEFYQILLDLGHIIKFFVFQRCLRRRRKKQMLFIYIVTIIIDKLI